MKKILLSFKPYWFEKIKSGQKIFEYRTRFCDEPVIAYMYVSRPVMAITGIIELGNRINLRDWKEEYKNDVEVLARIEDFATRNNYAMPIRRYQSTTSISLEELRSSLPGFIAPQMYYNLYNNVELLNFIEENIRILDEEIVHSFNGDIKDKICQK